MGAGLPPLEVGVPAIEKRVHRLPLVVRVETRRDGFEAVLDPPLDADRAPRPEDALLLAEDPRALGRQRRHVLLNGVVVRIGRRRAVHEPEVRSLRTGDRLARVDQFLGRLETHQPDEETALDPGHQPHVDLGEAERGVGRRHPEVTGHREFEARTESVAPAATDRDRIHVPDRADQPAQRPEERPRLADGERADDRQVEPAREPAVGTGPADDEDGNVVGDILDRFAQRGDALWVQEVQPAGVEPEATDVLERLVALVVDRHTPFGARATINLGAERRSERGCGFIRRGNEDGAMQPFSDVDVLDLTQSIAGPFATQLLGALGANVVKVEPPGGDDFRQLLDGSMFAAVNLGDKRSLCLDLKTEQGREHARQLAVEADVVVESFRPGVVERFDLDYESVTADNEDVVYCSISGFGDEGPYSDWPAYDPVLQSMSGLMSTTGYPDRPPVRIGASVIDCGTGMTAAFAIASALLERTRTGEGERIEVALFDVAVSWMGYWIADYSETGEIPGRSRPGGFAGMSPNGVFDAGDGEQLYVSVTNDTQFRRLCRALDREDLAEDDRFAESDARWEHRDELRETLTAAFAAYERDPLVERLVEAGVPSGPLHEVDDILSNRHVAERELLTRSRNLRTDEPVETTGVPFVTEDGRPATGDRPPRLGEHTRAVLAETGASAERIERMIENGVAREE